MKIPVYLQLEPNKFSGGQVTGARVASASSAYPRAPKGGHAIVYVELDLPSSAFDPVASATIKIPESKIELVVEADVPGGE